MSNAFVVSHDLQYASVIHRVFRQPRAGLCYTGLFSVSAKRADLRLLTGQRLLCNPAMVGKLDFLRSRQLLVASLITLFNKNQ